MGKSLKGKELGTGISQRKDGLYTARYTNRQGERKQKYFKPFAKICVPIRISTFPSSIS